MALQKSNWHLKAIVVHVTTSHKWKSMAGICSCQMGEKQWSISFGRWCKIIILWNKCIFFSSFYNLKVWQKKNMLKIVPRRRVYLCSDWLAIDFFLACRFCLIRNLERKSNQIYHKLKALKEKTKFRCSRMITSLVYWIKV